MPETTPALTARGTPRKRRPKGEGRARTAQRTMYFSADELVILATRMEAAGVSSFAAYARRQLLGEGGAPARTRRARGA